MLKSTHKTVALGFARTWYVWLLLLTALPAVTLLGCGGGGGTETVEEDEEERPRKTRTRRKGSKQDSQSVAAADQRKNGLGGIPYNVWPEVFNAPKVITPVTPGTPGTPDTGPMTPGTNEKPVSPVTPVTPPTTPTTPPPVTSTGDLNWADLISGDELDGEAKELANILKRGTSTVGIFRKARKEVSAAGSSLAAIAIIAQQHPDDIRWKDKAKFLRGFGSSIWEKADEDVSRDTWQATDGFIQDFNDAMSGSTPAGDPPEALSLYKSTDFGGLMRRMDQLYKAIKEDGSSADDFKSNKEVLKQRSAVLTVLFQIILDKEFDLAEEADYITSTQIVIDAGQEMRKSFLTDNFEGFSEAFGRINGSCNNCHQKFRE